MEPIAIEPLVGSSLPYLKINQRTEVQGHHALLQEVLPQNGW